MMEKNRMRLTGIRAPEQDDISLFSFTIRAGSATRSKDRRQTGDAGGVSSSVTAIDIVGAHHSPDKFLGSVVQLVRGLGTAEHAKVVRIVPRNGSSESVRNAVKSFIPGCRTMLPVFAHQRHGQALM